jgi:hypothetical protein
LQHALPNGPPGFALVMEISLIVISRGSFHYKSALVLLRETSFAFYLIVICHLSTTQTLTTGKVCAFIYTKQASWQSYMTSAVVEIGDDTLEVLAGRCSSDYWPMLPRARSWSTPDRNPFELEDTKSDCAL